MTSTFKTPNANLISFLALTFILTGLFACEDPGSVGDQFSDQESRVTQDTLTFNRLDSINVSAISGDKPFTTAGNYRDLLFGKYESVALIQPGIGDVNVDTLNRENQDITLSLQLSIDEANIWGDTLATAEYQLIEIAERWNEEDWTYGDTPNLTTNTIGEFTHQSGDSVRIALDEEWSDRYLEIFNLGGEMRDSTFSEQIFGFAVVPQNKAKLLPFDIGLSRLIISADSLENDLEQVIEQSATSLNRDQSPILTGDNFELSSTLNNSVSVPVDTIIQKLNSPVISNSIVAIKQNDSLLAATLPPNHIRPSLNETRLFFSTTQNIEELLVTSDQLGTVIPESPTSPRLELNITNNLERFIIDPDSMVNMYLIYGSGNGLIRSSLYFGVESNTLPPTIFVTGLEP